MLKAIKLIFTFAEVLPKKFLTNKLKQGSVQIQDLSDMGNLKSELEWDESYLEYLDNHFTSIFDRIFEGLIERIFKNNVNVVNRKDFVDAIDGTEMEKAKIYAEKVAKQAADRFRIFKQDEDELATKRMAKGPINWLFDAAQIRIYFESEYEKYREEN